MKKTKIFVYRVKYDFYKSEIWFLSYIILNHKIKMEDKKIKKKISLNKIKLVTFKFPLDFAYFY